MKTYILAIMVLVLISPLACAADSVRIEMPDNVVSGEMFQVKLVIDDPLVRDLTRTIDVTTKGGRLQLRRMGDIHSPSSIEYAGEEEIVFDAVMFSGFREGDVESTLSFRFMADVEEMRNKYPEWGTYHEDIVKVSKAIYASPVSFSVQTSHLPQTETSRFETDHWDKVTFTPVFRYYVDSDYYATTKFYRGSFSRESSYQTHDDYLVGRYFSKEDMTNPPENSKISGYDYGSFGQGGSSTGYYRIGWYEDYKVKHKNWDTNETYYVYEIIINYNYAVLINDFLMYHGNIMKKMRVKDSEIEGAIRETEEECHKIVLSQKYTPLEAGSATYPSVLETNLPLSGPKTLYVTGYAADADGNPMSYVEVQAKVKGQTFKGRADADGDFQIPLSIELDEKENDVKLDLWVVFSYERDDKNYFKVYDLDRNTYNLVWYHQKFAIIDQKNVEAPIRLDGSPDPKKRSSTGYISDMKSLSVIYAHTAEAVDFCLVELDADIDYKLPVEVLVGNNDQQTLYSPDQSRILISSNDAGYSNSNRPKNREYHEFAHHLMYATYGGWTNGSMVPGNRNHDGFLNPNTGDSYEEGFAEFMALVISDKYGDSNPADGKTKSDVYTQSDIYSSFGSLENNYRPWDNKGYAEEFAVASLLWDMYDKDNEKGDSLTMSLYNIWSVLKVQRNDFYDYYVAFKEANPSKAAEIDALFIEHGFFADTKVGNGKRDSFEGFRDANDNSRYDAGEFFFDLGCLNTTREIQYGKGMVIGKAANYDRPNRSSAVRLDGAYLKVREDEVKQYLIKVNYLEPGYGEDYEYVVDLRDGLLYLQPLPGHVAAEISIEPFSVEYTADSVYSISNYELISKLEDPGEYFDKHEFSLKSTGVTGDLDYVVYKDTEPVYAYEGDRGQDIDVKISDDPDLDDGKGLSLWWMLPVLIIGIVAGAGVLFLKKAGNVAGSVDMGKAQDRAQELIRKGSKEFNEKGMPAIKQAGKKAAEYTAKGAEFAANQTKEGYEKAKPQLKKAQDDIRRKIDEAKEKKE
ncbi:hypothetical protein [Methanolobus sp. WCC5]|uniref:hypothetical protein n=1 Tax=Methanolobus sp. WCC5 TaxID=3125785 RepID=UPI0032488023